MPIDLRDAVGTKPGELSKPAPVVDVWNRHVVKATGDAVGFAAAHHRNVDHFGDFAGNKARKMTDAARVLGIGKERHFSLVALVLEIAPDQFSDQRCGQHGFGIVTIARGNCSQLITIGLGPVTRFMNSAQRTVPDNDAGARMSSRDQAIDSAGSGEAAL